MPSALIIAVAVCLAAGACYVLLVVVDWKRRRRGVDTTGADSGGSWPWESGTSSGWFGNTATDVMGNPVDGGGSDSGSDGGGGDGGGGD
ncbi:conserved hypothetical protein; putative signal peptide [Bradyrhizobium sp. ORS 285]|uniref:hypothetical protein n=1 Tax=Bradyrhizobium sp. ORS 285 TaxID=115808 RepID=UPI0002407997|nr:hypothetical protein [Bradyrhizobium sp. ORS 285]CCD90244.1 conserved exported hypothetical protein [Bradyrhizobium sp. ORS 285]SMX60491.1 conserved hypothetical protein; putative signal peptide [Bradyrhizobium sp. ORS 285]